MLEFIGADQVKAFCDAYAAANLDFEANEGPELLPADAADGGHATSALAPGAASATAVAAKAK